MAVLGGNKPLIWLIGCNGMLGRELSLLLESRGTPYIGTGREVDITDRGALFSHAEAQGRAVSWIINCAAYTAVDKAEGDAENCRMINTEAAGNIACLARSIGAGFVHISTDYVFNGRENRPYKEEDLTDPVGIYGLTKRDGEIRVLKENADAYIFRTSWLYGGYGGNFVHTMLRLMKEQESVRVVDDQRGSPTWTRDLAEVIIALTDLDGTGKTAPCGIYHFSSEGEICWFNFAREIQARGRTLGILARECELIPCGSAGFPGSAKRPAYSVLDKTKIKTAMGIKIPSWDESLCKFLSEKTNA